MKKIIALLLVLILGGLPLAGCGGGDGGDGTAPGDTAESASESAQDSAPESSPESSPEQESGPESESGPEMVRQEVEEGIFINYPATKFKIGNAPYILIGIDGNSQITFLHNGGVDFEKEADNKLENQDVNIDTEVTLGGYAARKLAWYREDFGMYYVWYLIEYGKTIDYFEGVIIELFSYEDELDSPVFMDVLNSYTVEREE